MGTVPGHIDFGHDVDVAFSGILHNLAAVVLGIVTAVGDVVVDTQGNAATVGEIQGQPDPSQMASMENPDVAPDMPDYMNDANIDDMNVLT